MGRRTAALLAAAAAVASAFAGEPAQGRLLLHASYRPAALALAPEDRDFLGYAIDELPRARHIDIDGDGIPDNFVLGADILCGTGGCPVLLLDGRSGHRLGEFFGTISVLAARAGGRAMIQVLSRRDSERSNLETHVFSAERYRRVDHRLLDPDAVANWRTGMEEH